MSDDPKDKKIDKPVERIRGIEHLEWSGDDSLHLRHHIGENINAQTSDRPIHTDTTNSGNITKSHNDDKFMDKSDTSSEK